MKSQKALIVMTIILVITALTAQSIYIRKAKTVSSEITTTDLSTTVERETNEVIITEERVEEDHQKNKITREQVVQISANAFVSFFITNDENDRLLLKDYSTKELFEKIINDTSLTEKREILLVNLKELTLEKDDFKTTYAVDVQTDKGKQTVTVKLKLVEVNDNWVVSDYEIN